MALCAGALALAACTHTPAAQHPKTVTALTRKAQIGPDLTLGDTAPNPAKEQIDGDALDKLRNLPTRDR